MHCGYHLTHPLLCLNEGSFTAVVESNSNSNTRPKKKKKIFTARIKSFHKALEKFLD